MQVFLVIICIVLNIPICASTAAASPKEIAIDISVQLGRDHGQSLGTVFEFSTNDGTISCGAGFISGYQVRRSVNSHMLEFYCRGKAVDKYELTDVGKPSAQVMRPELSILDDRLVEVTSRQQLTQDRKAWKVTDALAINLQNVQPLRNDYLYFSYGNTNSAHYEGKLIAESRGDLKATLFYGNKLYFVVSKADGQLYLDSCEWDPYTTATCGQVTSLLLDNKHARDIYGIIGLKGDLFLVGDGATVLRVRGKQVKLLAQHKIGQGEFYSLLLYGNKLLTGHVPEGVLYEIDPLSLKVTRLTDTPPLPVDQYLPSEQLDREAQSLTLYRGELLVGQYPWGLLWRHDKASGTWTFYRPFSFPKLVPKKYPFVDEMSERQRTLKSQWNPQIQGSKWLIVSTWGQRIHSLLNFGEYLAIGLGNNSNYPYDPVRDTFMTAAQSQEYGAVKLLRLPGTVASHITWREKMTKFRFVVSGETLRVFQDGKILGQAFHKLDLKKFEMLPRIGWGNGIFGEFGGKFLSRDISSTAP